MVDNIFDDIDQVDWTSLGYVQAPLWIQGLISEDPLVRAESFDDLRDSDIHERLNFAWFVVPYVLRILEYQEVNEKTNEETEVLIAFLRALRHNAVLRKERGTDMENSEVIINDINNSMKLFKNFLKRPLTSDAARDLIFDIEDLWD